MHLYTKMKWAKPVYTRNIVNPYVKVIQRAAFDAIGLIAVDKGPVTNMLINAKKRFYFSISVAKDMDYV